MEEYKIELTVRRLATEGLSCEARRLYGEALRAAKQAYAPYSHFQVGAAVLLSNGTVVTGTNQENVAYPSGMCAERVALFYAGASFPDTPVRTLAIVAVREGEIRKTIAPCGACRQVLLEMERRHGRPIQILLCGCDETIVISSAGDLLPLSFNPKNML